MGLQKKEVGGFQKGGGGGGLFTPLYIAKTLNTLILL